ncbi:hypothetical protein [Thermosipho africanus]|uniref:hypothetical protein n=1 Tax=Thermosipho africanus TaxID=2421 RepID=UPI001305354F|nr:hypothetical protein [Thermosipho africanus]
MRKTHFFTLTIYSSELIVSISFVSLFGDEKSLFTYSGVKYFNEPCGVVVKINV